MSTTSIETLELEQTTLDQNQIQDQDQIQDQIQNQNESEEWKKMSQSWLYTFPDGRTPTMSEFEYWLVANHESLPQDVKSMPRSQIYQILISIHKNLSLTPHQDKEGNEGGLPPAKFQRTEQWLPVYSWLESLDSEDVVKSADVIAWLTRNPMIRDELSSKHSRYHLTHYIKKCHAKILKRRQRKKDLQNPNRTPVALKARKMVVAKQLTPGQSDLLKNIPKDSDLYILKRNEAIQKYEILVDLEKQLSTLFPQHKTEKFSMES